MNDVDFQTLCKHYGFAPSRALRELLDTATRQATHTERMACAALCELWDASHPVALASAIRRRGSEAAAPVGAPAGEQTGPVAAAPTP